MKILKSHLKDLTKLRKSHIYRRSLTVIQPTYMLQQKQRKKRTNKVNFKIASLKTIEQLDPKVQKQCEQLRNNSTKVILNFDISQFRQQYHKTNLLSNIEKKQSSYNFPISKNLLETKNFKAIKHSIKNQWRSKKINHSQLIIGYKLLTTIKTSKKLLGKCNLLQCYEPERLDVLSFNDCVKSPTCNILKLIKVFQSHLIYNYVHTINLIFTIRPEQLNYFLFNGRLFNHFTPNQFGHLSKSNLLNDICFLGHGKVPKIKANYQKISCNFFSKCYGIFRLPQQFDDSTYFLYNVLVLDGNTRFTLEQFQREQDKLYIVLSETSNLQQLFAKLTTYYSSRNENWFDQICYQLTKTQNPSSILSQLLECCPNQTTADYLKSTEIAYQRLLQLSSDKYVQCEQLSIYLSTISNVFEDEEYEEIKAKMDRLKQMTIISQIIDNFNISYQFHTIVTFLMKIPAECEKCINQLLENYHVNRVKQYSFKLADRTYDLQKFLELRSLLWEGFKQVIKSESKIEVLIFRKCLDFGKYRELKLFYQQIKLTTQDFDDSISEAMNRYLKLQKNIPNIEDERKKFLEIVKDVQLIRREKLMKTKKMMKIYKFINESKELGDYRSLDQTQCNQTIFQIFRKTQNLDLPYIGLKKKLARANDLKVYDSQFCKFMIELAQKNLLINPQKSHLILEDLLKNGDDEIQTEVAIIQLKLSKDSNKQTENLVRLLKNSQSAEIVQTLLTLYKSKQQIVLIPEKIDILSKQMIDVPLENSFNLVKFEQEYKKFYTQNLANDIFLDLLVKDPDEAFFVLSKRNFSETQGLIQQLAESNLMNSEVLLIKYLETQVGSIDIITQLSSDNDHIRNLTEALVISKHKQIFSKSAMFDKKSRTKQILERLEQLELDNIVPELGYFQGLNIKGLKMSVFTKKLTALNLRAYYLNSDQQIKSYIKNQIKLNPSIVDLQIDLRYHFIIYEDIYGFTNKEKGLIRAFINQCLLANNKVQFYDRIYKQIISKEYQFELVQLDFQQILDSSNIFIISEIADYYYKKQSTISEFYSQQLIKNRSQEQFRDFWLRNESKDPTISVLKEQIQANQSKQQMLQQQEII